MCEAKHCWLADTDDVPAEELSLWVAFYELEEEQRKRDERDAKIKAGRNK